MHGYKWPINCTRTRTAGTTVETTPETTESDEQGSPRRRRRRHRRVVTEIVGNLQGHAEMLEPAKVLHIIRNLETMHE